MTGLELRAAREALGLTITEMAQELQVARETIWRWETEHVQVSRVVELALAALKYNKENKS